MILVDSNVLLYSVDSRSPWHVACHDVVERCMGGALDAVLVPQVLTEFVAIVTSRRMRSPIPTSAAVELINEWRGTCPMRYPNARCLDEFEMLLPASRRSAQHIHDVFLAAQMRAHGIAEICTLNVGDFSGIPGITVREPASV